MRWPWQKKARRHAAAVAPPPGILSVQADMQSLRMEFTDNKTELKDLRRKMTALCAEISQRTNCPELFDAEPVAELAAGDAPRGTNGQPVNKHHRCMVKLQRANAGIPLPLGAWATPIDDDDGDEGDAQ